jgi:riboflavin synthase
MFTGIIQAVGTVESLSRRGNNARLIVNAPGLARPIAHGASVCVSGVCLSATGGDAARIEFDVVGETLARSTLGSLHPGDRVNLEPSLRASDRMDGHVVQGHVDGMAVLRALGDNAAGGLWTFETGPEITPYLIPKGSIAVDGISLTIAEVGERSFGIALIPTTLATTTLGNARVGHRVNIETDILVRTIVTTLRRVAGGAAAAGPGPGSLTVEMLRENGW